MGSLIQIDPTGEIRQDGQLSGEAGTRALMEAAQMRRGVAGAQMQQPNVEVQVDPITFFDPQTNVPSMVQNQEASAPRQNYWWENFAKQYHDQEFRDLDHYTSWIANMKDHRGQLVSDRSILPYIQQQSKKYMPPRIRQEYEAKLQAQQAQRQQESMLAQMKKYNETHDDTVMVLKKGQPEIIERKIHEQDRIKQRYDVVRDFLKMSAEASNAMNEPLALRLAQKAGELEQQILAEQMGRDQGKMQPQTKPELMGDERSVYRLPDGREVSGLPQEAIMQLPEGTTKVR